MNLRIPLFLALLSALALSCSAAEFGLGEEDTGTDSESETSDPPDTLSEDSGITIDSMVPDVKKDSAAETVASDTPAVETLSDVVTTEADVEVNRCKGRGIPTGHIAALYLPPPIAERPNGYLGFAGSIDGGTWQDPWPECVAAKVDVLSHFCDFGATGGVFRFLIGAMATAPEAGYPLDPTRPFTFVTGGVFSAPYGVMVACKGDIEIGSYETKTGFIGKLSQDGTTVKFKITP